MLSYGEIKSAVGERLARAGLSVEMFPVAPGPICTEGYYYEIHGPIYVYAYTERGEHTVICRTRDVDEFYYRIIKDIVVYKATRYEVENRVPGQDTRRLWMKKAEEWMGRIDPGFGEKLGREFAEILEEYPFTDG